MMFGPVLRAELLTTARRRRYYALRVVLTLLMLWIMWISPLGCGQSQNRLRTMSVQQIANHSREVFYIFMSVLGGAVILLTPAVIAGAIAEEKQRKTLHYLLASQLGSAEIIGDKLMARTLLILFLLTAALPIMSISNLFGGVPPEWYFWFYLASLSMMFLLASLSMLISVYVKRTRDALITVYMLIIVWGFGPSLIELFQLFGGAWGEVYDWIGWATRPFAVCSPLSFTFAVTGAPFQTYRGSTLPEIVLQMCSTQIAFGLLMLIWAVLRLRPVYRKQGGESAGRGRLAKLRESWSRRRPPCGDDPMSWKERRFARLGLLPQIAGALVLISFAVGLTIGLYFLLLPAANELFVHGSNASFNNDPNNGYWNQPRWQQRQHLSEFLRVYSGFFYTFILLATAVRAAAGITVEKEQDCWISLISTPLDPWPILRAKILGSILGIIWLPAALVALWVFGLVMTAVHPAGFLLNLALLTVYLWFAAALGTFVSLGAKSTMRAQITTIIILIVCNGGYMLCCSTPFLLANSEPRIIIAAGVTPMQIGYGLASYWDIHTITHLNSIPHYNPSPQECAIMLFGSFLLYGIGAAAMT